jgi:hypothetical protein
MRHGDIKGKGKIYTEKGKPILDSGEYEVTSDEGTLIRGWVRYKLGWRTIMFKGVGTFYFTNKRLIYLEMPEYVNKIHTFNIDHELGDFGGWDYHAHRMRRAVEHSAFIFLELPLDEITEVKHKGEESTVFAKDAKHKYKIIVEGMIGDAVENVWQKRRYDA